MYMCSIHVQCRMCICGMCVLHVLCVWYVCVCVVFMCSVWCLWFVCIYIYIYICGVLCICVLCMLCMVCEYLDVCVFPPKSLELDSRLSGHLNVQ